jgi:hypothetical protein
MTISYHVPTPGILLSLVKSDTNFEKVCVVVGLFITVGLDARKARNPVRL